jgi:hypothetical protein
MYVIGFFRHTSRESQGEYEMRGYDATHLAAALLWKETLETPVIYDCELSSAAKKAGMLV